MINNIDQCWIGIVFFVIYHLGIHNEDFVMLGYGYLRIVVVSMTSQSIHHVLEIALVTIWFGIVHVVNLGIQIILLC